MLTYTGDQVNAGTYYVTATTPATPTTTASDGAAFAIVINKAASTTTTVGDGPFTYDGTTHTGGSGTVTGAGGLTPALRADLHRRPGQRGHLLRDGALRRRRQPLGQRRRAVAIMIDKASSTTTTVGDGPFTYDGTTHTGGSGTVTGAGGLSTRPRADLHGRPGQRGHLLRDGALRRRRQPLGQRRHRRGHRDRQGRSTTTTVGDGPFTYDGTTHTGGSGTVTGAGASAPARTSLTYSGDQVNAGTYYVTAHYAGDTNHEASDGLPVGIVINQAVAKVTVSGYTGTYDAAAHGATATVVGVPGDLAAAGSSFNPGTSFTDVPGGTATGASRRYQLHRPERHGGDRDQPKGSHGERNHRQQQAIRRQYSCDTELRRRDAGGCDLARQRHAQHGGRHRRIRHGSGGRSQVVTISGLTLGGADAGNYSLTQPTAVASITAWSLSGFLQPVGIPNTYPGMPSVTTNTLWNTIKGGQTVPLKFNIYTSVGGTQLTSVTDVKQPGFVLAALPCAPGQEDPVDPDFTATGATILRYDGTQFIQNWQTPKGANQCYRITMTARDGSQLTAFFKTK